MRNHALLHDLFRHRRERHHRSASTCHVFHVSADHGRGADAPPKRGQLLSLFNFFVPVRLPVAVATDDFGSKRLSVPSALIAGLQLSELIMHGIFGERQHKQTISTVALYFAEALNSF